MKTQIVCQLRRVVLALGLSVSLLAQSAENEASSSGTANDGDRPRVEQRATHRIIPGDKLSIQILQDSDLNTEVMVDLDGKISMQLIGDIAVVGLKMSDVTKRIRDAYEKDYIYDPVVSVSIVEYGKKRFTVIGAVRQPGDYLFRANQTVNILQAIGIAGGYSAEGDPRKITVKRKVNGEEQVFKLDGRAMARDKGVELFTIESNDIVSVGESLF